MALREPSPRRHAHARLLYALVPFAAICSVSSALPCQVHIDEKVLLQYMLEDRDRDTGRRNGHLDMLRMQRSEAVRACLCDPNDES